MLIAAVVDNHDLHERERTTPLHLLGGAVTIDRTHILDHVFLRHHVDLFHLAPQIRYAPLHRRGEMEILIRRFHFDGGGGTELELPKTHWIEREVGTRGEARPYFSRRSARDVLQR